MQRHNPGFNLSTSAAITSTLSSVATTPIEEQPTAMHEQLLVTHAQNQPNSTLIMNSEAYPQALAKVLYSQLSLKEKSYLARSCLYFHTLFQPELAQEAPHQLMLYVMQGNQDAAEKMLKANPALLLIPTFIDTKEDYSGRSFTDTTAFQAALRMQDVEMWQMIEKYFKQLPDGNTAKATQFYAEFPDGEPIAQQPYDLSSLVNIILESNDEAIQAQLRGEQNDSKICKAFNAFRVGFTQHSLREKHFNPQHLLSALTVWEAQFDLWSVNQHNLFCQQVFGYMQRYMPACYAQAFAQGLYYITPRFAESKVEEALRRTFNYRCNYDSPILPLDSNPSLRLGYEIYVGGSWGAMGGMVPNTLLIKYVKQKQQHLANLKQECETLKAGLTVRNA